MRGGADDATMSESIDNRILKALGIYAFGVLGVFLVVSPWTGLWRTAVTVLLPTEAGPLMAGGWIRGVVSGLGVVDLMMAGQMAGELWRQMRGGPVDPEDPPPIVPDDETKKSGAGDAAARSAEPLPRQ